MSQGLATFRPVEEWENPWRELRRREHLVFRLDRHLSEPLPDGVRGVYWPRQHRSAVIISSRLDQRERRAALAHELVHDERGGGVEFLGQHDMWDAVVAREEHIVEREVARHLVPRHKLIAFIEQRMTVEPAGVTIHEVADEFEVPDHVAERALRQLAANP